MESRLSRGAFITAAALAAALAGGADAAAQGDTPAVRLPRVDRALVLSGGGARGAYEAGIIDYLVSSKQCPDGTALPPYGLVCGTSIGALNGYFVATGQYSLLRRLWYSMAREMPVQLKPEYRKIPDNDSGVGSRVLQGVHLAAGLHSTTRGVYDGDRLRDWLARYIDPQLPVLVPFIFPTTNLTTQRPEFFYLTPGNPDPAVKDAAAKALQSIVGPDVQAREATPDILIDALRASAAIPIAFDPVSMMNTAGEMCENVDGGVIANTPVAAARAGAKALDVIFLDPPVDGYAYGNAVEIATGVFGAMQRRILDADIRSAYLETIGKREFERSRDPATRALAATLYDVDIYTIHPQKQLPVSVIGFDDADGAFATYEMGFADARSGFLPFTPRTRSGSGNL